MIETVFATADFPATTEAGAQVMVRKGSHWPADDPLVAAHPGGFSTDPRWGLQYTREPAGWDDPPVERATRGPGERRNMRRRDHEQQS